MPPVLRFLNAVFRKAIASTTHCENGFAHKRQYLNKCVRPPNFSSLAAHQVLLESKRMHGQWLQNESENFSDTDKRRLRFVRPSWLRRPVFATARARKGSKKRISTLNCFVRAMLPDLRAEHPRLDGETRVSYRDRMLALASSTWNAKTPAGRREWLAQRAAARAAARLAPDPLEDFIAFASNRGCDRPESPWGLADLRYPVAESLLEDRQGSYDGAKSFVSVMSQAWYTEFDQILVGSGAVHEGLTVDTPCGEICNRCLGCLGTVLEKHIFDLSKIVHLAARRGLAPDREEAVLRFRPTGAPDYVPGLLARRSFIYTYLFCNGVP